MATLDELNIALDNFEARYRGPNLPALQRSDLYDLFPDHGGTLQNVTVCGRWPNNSWPQSNNSGLYVILDSKLEVLYVGVSGRIGPRLSDYFKYDPNGGCQVRHNWTNPPRYLLTVSTEAETDFERFSLEQYLIRELTPPDNTRGR